MKAIALIPARLNATRFPRKLLADLMGKTVIRRTLEGVQAMGLFADLVVVTDSDEIEQEVRAHGGHVVRSTREYESGTDRIAEAAEHLEADVFVNVQGDEPFVQREALASVLELFEGEAGAQTLVASLATPMDDPALIADPNYVKVALDLSKKALLFSRSPIPYQRDKDAPITFYEHIGVYAFRKQALMDFTKWPQTPMERAEKIECLRFLEVGVPIHMVITDHPVIEIDTPEDIGRAERLMAKMGWT